MGAGGDEMWEVVSAPRGRYACGCRAEIAVGSNGTQRMIPLCARHGHRLALWTALLRKARLVATRSFTLPRGLSRRRAVQSPGSLA